MSPVGLLGPYFISATSAGTDAALTAAMSDATGVAPKVQRRQVAPLCALVAAALEGHPSTRELVGSGGRAGFLVKAL